MSVTTTIPSTEEAFMQQWEPLARHLARRYSGAAEREDLEQVARLALLRAKRRFDPERGVRFSTYAVPTILGELRRFLRDRGQPFHVPRRCWDLSMRLKKAADELRQNLGHEPTVAELAAALEVSQEEVAGALGVHDLFHLESLDESREDTEGEEADSLAVRIGTDDPGLEAVESRVAVRQAMQGLPRRLREIVRRRYFAGQSQRQIGRALGLSQMQISRLERRALEGLREELSSVSPTS